MTVWVTFMPDDIAIEAEVGEAWLDVADRAGIFIPTGCLMGSCGACEVDLEGKEIRCCISSIPPGSATLTATLFSDPTW